MAKRTNIREITSWFNLKNYDFFESYPLEDILFQIRLRCIFLIVYTPFDSETEQLDAQKRVLEQIKKGKLDASLFDDFITEQSIESNDDNIEFIVNGASVISLDHSMSQGVDVEDLSSGEAITPFTMGDLVTYHRYFARHGFIEEDDRTVSIRQGKVFTSVNMADILDERFGDDLLIKVDIASHTDEELLLEFKELLKVWRDETGHEEPSYGNSRVGISSFKKILDYRIIPLLDLMLWELVEERKISNEILSRILFPISGDDIKGAQQIRDTIRPFAERFTLGYEFLIQMENYLKKHDYLKNMRISEVMKLAENE